LIDCIAGILEDPTTVIIDSASYADLIKAVGYPIMNNLPGIIFAIAAAGAIWFFFKKARK